MQFHLPLKDKKAKPGKKQIYFWFTKKTIALYAILFIAFFICLAVFVSGGGLAQSTTFTLSFSTPAEGQAFTSGSVLISGYAIGGVLKSVTVWDQKYNVGMPASTSVSLWTISIPVNQFSNGQHVMCVKGQSTDGSWSAIICRTISIYTATHVNATGYVSDTIPGGILFRPAEMLERGVVVLVSGGTASDDQNGDNIPDQFQQNPITPNYNPSNVPILMMLVFVAFIFLLIIIVFGIKEYLSKREVRLKALQSNPSYWKWKERK